jgi:hypothetical protein
MASCYKTIFSSKTLSKNKLVCFSPLTKLVIQVKSEYLPETSRLAYILGVVSDEGKKSFQTSTPARRGVHDNFPAGLSRRIQPRLQPGRGSQLRPARLARHGQEVRRALLPHEAVLRLQPR